MKHPLLVQQVKQAAINDPSWFQALLSLSAGEHVDSLICNNEKYQRPLHGKLASGGPTLEFCTNYIVRFRNACIVGEGKTMKEAWEDALETAKTVIWCVNN